MSDPLDDFSQGLPPMTPMPPSEVRRRGDRLRRRNTALTVAGGALAAALAIGAPVVALSGGSGDDDVQPAPSVTQTRWVTQVPADFPIAGQSPIEDGWATGPGEVIASLEVCQAPAWSPGASTDAVGASISGGESSVERTLALYPDDAAATQALGGVRSRLTECAAPGAETTLATDAGEESLGYGAGGFVTSLTRVGNALLVDRTFVGDVPAQDGARDVAAALQPVVDRMCVFSATPCASPAAPASEIPTGFALDLGWQADADTTIEGPGHGVEGVFLTQSCGADVWPGTAGVDRLATRLSGIEFGEARELVVYPDAEAATAAVAAVRSSYAECSLPDGAPPKVLDVDPGYDSFGFGIVSDGLYGQVWLVVRNGRAVIALETSGEMSESSLQPSAEALGEDARTLAPTLCTWTRAGC